MPSIRYMNQSAPFWDFIASLEQQGAEHPMLAGRNRNEHESSDEETGWAGPWGWGGWGWPGAGRGGHRGPHGPPPYPGAYPPPPHHDGAEPPHPPEKDGPSGPPGEPADPPESVPPPHDGPEHDRRGHHGRHGRHHGPPGPHGPHGDREHFRRGGRCGGRGGFRGPWGRRGMGAFNMSALSDFIQSQMFEAGAGYGNEREQQQQQDFKPEADVFDTEAAFVVHVSLPGAKKEDVAVNWDAEKSELSVAGVVHRPGDEEFLKTLALDERSIGAFERKIRLGSRANPALVDVDGISAKFEDGVLVVTVPKEDKDFIEVKKVDIE